MPDPISATVATVGAGLIGGIKSSNDAASANKKAVNAQRESAQQQLDFQREMYNRSREDFTPYRDLGSFAAGRLGQRIGMPTDYGNRVSGMAGADTRYNTPEGLINIPYGSTMFQNSGGTLVGARNPQGGWADLSKASPYEMPQAPISGVKTAADLMKKYGLPEATGGLGGVNTYNWDNESGGA